MNNKDNKCKCKEEKDTGSYFNRRVIDLWNSKKYSVEYVRQLEKELYPGG